MRVYQLWAATERHRAARDRAVRTIVAAAKQGICAVAMSWGKDSTVLAHLVLMTLGGVDLLHLQYPDDLPGGDSLRAWWLRKPGVMYHEQVAPDHNDQILAHERTKSQQARAVAAVKKNPGIQQAKHLGYVVLLTGLRASENPNTRGWNYKVRGDLYQLRAGMWVGTPLATWSARDVWAYIASERLPYHPMYDNETHGLTRETIRNTGWLATDGATTRGRVAWLRQHYPAQYRQLIQLHPEMRSLA